MNKDLTTLSDAELSAWLGEVLQPKPGNHDADKGSEFLCVKCGVLVYSMDNEYVPPPCIPDPIPLDDWNVAMKWRDWGVDEYGYKYALALDCVLNLDDKMVNGKMKYVIAQSRHYLIAAAKLKEKK